MALIEIHADLSRTAAALERIADVLERMLPNTVVKSNPGRIGPDRVTRVTDESLWQRQNQSPEEGTQEPEKSPEKPR